MARIVKDNNENELLGISREFDSEKVAEKLNEQDVEKVSETTLAVLAQRLMVLQRMSQNDKKQYKKGVITLHITCSKCGRNFIIQMKHYMYHKLLKLHFAKYQKETRLADNQETSQLLYESGASKPMVETFLYQLCPACISQIKCQLSENPAENVEKSSL